jgi:hypothetical protein
MATLNPFKNGKGITLVSNKVITLTKRTVRFPKNVYQTHNITGFSEGEVEIGMIPWWIIIFFLFYALFMINSDNWAGANYFLYPGLAGLGWNLIRPKHYGLLLTLNSGDKTLFTTTKTESLKKIIVEIYDFIEAEKEATYEISISNSQVSGNFIQGNAGGNTSYGSDD